MNTNIYRLETICDSILNYADEKKGALDEKGKTEVKAFKVKLVNFDSRRHATRESFANAKASYAIATADLKRGIMQGRKAIEIVTLGQRKLPNLPLPVKGKWLPSRIYNVASKYFDALQNVGDDPVVVKAGKNLKTLMDVFANVQSNMNAQQSVWKKLCDEIDEETSVIGGKLASYKMYVTYNVPRVERQILRNRIKSVVPPKGKFKADAAATDNAASAPAKTVVGAQIPALPAIPVPPSSEHLVMSANA
ncbi:MAG: hypothetical protein HY897_11065 [Deltaproteobacteria bacterium]|nr:hypothetical protein [Deltaproteobacteria bacterium]